MSKTTATIRIYAIPLISLILTIAILIRYPMRIPALAQTDDESTGDRIEIIDFDLLNAQTGWVWINNHLYWSMNNGATWQDITPSEMNGLQLSAVHFPNPTLGFAVLGKTDNGDQQSFWLAKSDNPRAGWTYQEIKLPDNTSLKPAIAKIQITFLDRNYGWLMLKYASSPNFNLGALYLTRDGGTTWTKSNLDLAGEIYFSNPEIGWITTDEPFEEMLQTRDGGFSWQAFHDLPALPPLQKLNNLENHGYLSKQNSLRFAKGSPIGVDRSINISPNADPFWQGMDRVDLFDDHAGWATYSKGQCDNDTAGQMTCRRDLGLLKTENGGVNWSVITLPVPIHTKGLIKESITINSNAETFKTTTNEAPQSLTAIYQGHAFDKCEVPTLTQLQEWIVSSPYRGLNLYIGGSLRACANSALTADYIAQIRDGQGWSLIPTWVGPQAPCTNYKSKISSNASTAYQQGINEANSALTIAAALNIAHPDQSGTILYYDLEYYDTTNASCNNAVKSFISGWITQIHAKGSLAGVYSTGAVLNQITSIAILPDSVWPAHWIYSEYNPDATVWDVYRLSNEVWNQHQRIRQYSGGHYETWGNVKLNIDSNVMDGIVLSSWRGNLSFPNRVFLPWIEK
ncbi:MAG: glycoside hydrolase domain-containing protein [Anaerolineales bacterium]